MLYALTFARKKHDFQNIKNKNFLSFIELYSVLRNLFYFYGILLQTERIRRRIAKEILQEFIEIGDFYLLPHEVQEALLIVAPTLKERRVYSFKNKEALHEVC